MKQLTYKTKIFLAIGFLVVFIGGMFLFGYGIIASRNQIITDKLSEKTLEWEVLKREQESFEKGKVDLAVLEKASYPPEELFSRDTKLVKEIQQLESAAQLHGLELVISISGTVESAIKAAGTRGELFVVPYTLTLTGDFAKSLMFIQNMEHLPFVTRAREINITSNPDTGSSTVISADFFIKK